MRIHRLDVTDLVATLLVAGAATIYAAGQAGADLPGLGGVRARACAVFLFGMLACGTGARRDAFEGKAAERAGTAVLSAVGALTLIVGLIAIVLGSGPYLTALMVGIGVLWAGATVRHLVTEPTLPVTAKTEHRELVKR
jgi:peptidoglycan/LPS O-acetylase OafA/YrhL